MHSQRELTVVVLCVCVFSNICSTTTFSVSFQQNLHVFSDFDSWILQKCFVHKVWQNDFFVALTLLALRQLRVVLLDVIAFEELPLVVCAKGMKYKNSLDTSLYPFAS